MINYIKYFLIVIVLVFNLPHNIIGATPNDSITKPKQTLNVGLRFQKAAGFYWSNGLTAEYSSEKLFKQKMSLGFNFISSKLGSALMSNAIPFYEIEISGIKYFRQNKNLKPLLRLNVGYAHANYGSDIFKNIPNQSLLCSIETGISYYFKFPLKVSLSGGYNIITGNGTSGLGTIYPVYGQCSVFYTLPNKKK